MSNPFNLPDTTELAEEVAELRGNKLMCLVNIAPILAAQWTAAREEFMRTYEPPASFVLPEDSALIKSDPQRMKLRSEAEANAHADEHGIAPGVVAKNHIFRLGPTEDLTHVRSAQEPYGKMTRPTIEVLPVDELARRKRARPSVWVLKSAREARMFLREYGPTNRGRMDHQDRGLREWTPELHEGVILPYLKKIEAHEAAVAASAGKRPGAPVRQPTV